jgi:hypothetical protein
MKDFASELSKTMDMLKKIENNNKKVAADSKPPSPDMCNCANCMESRAQKEDTFIKDISLTDFILKSDKKTISVYSKSKTFLDKIKKIDNIGIINRVYINDARKELFMYFDISHLKPDAAKIIEDDEEKTPFISVSNNKDGIKFSIKFNKKTNSEAKRSLAIDLKKEKALKLIKEFDKIFE